METCPRIARKNVRSCSLFGRHKTSIDNAVALFPRRNFSSFCAEERHKNAQASRHVAGHVEFGIDRKSRNFVARCPSRRSRENLRTRSWKSSQFAVFPISPRDQWQILGKVAPTRRASKMRDVSNVTRRFTKDR